MEQLTFMQLIDKKRKLILEATKKEVPYEFWDWLKELDIKEGDSANQTLIYNLRERWHEGVHRLARHEAHRTRDPHLPVQCQQQRLQGRGQGRSPS